MIYVCTKATKSNEIPKVPPPIFSREEKGVYPRVGKRRRRRQTVCLTTRWLEPKWPSADNQMRCCCSALAPPRTMVQQDHVVT